MKALTITFNSFTVGACYLHRKCCHCFNAGTLSA